MGTPSHTYAGIGSRKAPSSVLQLMTRLATRLESLGLLLRSGAADGADAAFEAGIIGQRSFHTCEIFLPWGGFNGHVSPLHDLPNLPDALELAARHHPGWHRLSRAARLLHARNCYQILGANLDQPCAFVVAWTPDGCEHAQDRTAKTGGTGQAIALADHYGIPVFNLANGNALMRLRDRLIKLGLEVRDHVGQTRLSAQDGAR